MPSQLTLVLSCISMGCFSLAKALVVADDPDVLLDDIKYHGLKADRTIASVTAPQRFNLDLETKGGDVVVGNLTGELHAVTAGGDIQAGDVTGACA